MESTLLITIACSIGLVYSLLKESWVSKISNGVMFIGIAMSWIIISFADHYKNYFEFSMFIFFSGAALLAFTHLFENRASDLRRISMFLFAILAITPPMCRMFRWPGETQIILLGLLPIAIVIVLLIMEKINSSKFLSGIIAYSLLCAINFLRVYSDLIE